MATTSSDSNSSSSINWDLCCLCQLQSDDPLQTPKSEGLLSLERDLKDFIEIANALPSCVNVTIDQMNDGSGIASTLVLNKAKYHKHCRSYCSSSRVKRVRKHEDHALPSLLSPKKLRSSHPQTSGIHCVICEGEDTKDLHKALTNNVDSKMKSWAESSKNFKLLGRLVTQASDVHAADVYYHTKCYLNLRYEAQVAQHKTSSSISEEASTSESRETFDPLTIAQIVALVEDSDCSFTISNLRQLYRTLMNERGHVCCYKEPHTTRFKIHLLSLLPDWSEHQKVGGRETYIASKQKVEDSVARDHNSDQIDQDEALLLTRAALVLHKYCLQPVHKFDGTLPSNCLTVSVPEPLRVFNDIVLQGPGLLKAYEDNTEDDNLKPRSKMVDGMVVIMYSKSCGCSGVDEARQWLFSNGTKSLENLPPTQAALTQHVKRALLQASFYWSQTTSVKLNIPNFGMWGWNSSTTKTWEPYWTHLPDASTACAILLRCGCKKSCSGRCKCFKSGVSSQPHCVDVRVHAPTMRV